MNPHRRTLLTGLGLAALAAGTARAAAQTPAVAATPKPSLGERLGPLAAKHRLAVAFNGDNVSGPGFDKLVEEGKAARFFMVGEEHGVAQVPALVTRLMAALKPAGYARLGLEISPPTARAVDQAARGGIEGLKRFNADHPPGPPFYTMAEEAGMLAAVRAMLPGEAPVLFGLDYEVFQDRMLIALLKAKAPASAIPALAKLEAASNAGWDQFLKTRNVGLILPFSGDPALVRAVRAAWPKPDAASEEILETLEQTLVINQHQAAERYFDSNNSRAVFNRANWARLWRTEGAKARPPKMMFKFGGGHMMRGRSPTEVYDIGNLVSETAVLRGETSFNLLVVPADGGRQAYFNPETFPKVSTTAVETVAELSLQALAAQALPGSSTLFDLRPLRAEMPSAVASADDTRLARVVRGYDAMLLIADARPSGDL